MVKLLNVAALAFVFNKYLRKLVAVYLVLANEQKCSLKGVGH